MRFFEGARRRTVSLAIGSAFVLGGCSIAAIHESADEAAQMGQYERAIDTLQAGLKRHPESVELKGALVSTQSRAAETLLADAYRERSNQHDQAAADIVKRVLLIAPDHPRALGLLADIQRDARHAEIVKAAQAALKAGNFQRAWDSVQPALVESPTDPELLALQKDANTGLNHNQAYAAPRMGESHPLSLEFRDANLKMVLEALSRETGINFILDKDIRSDLKITVFLRQSSLESALDLVLGTNQLAKKVIDSHTVQIYANTPDKLKEYEDLVVRSYFLANANAKDMAAMLRSVLKLREPYVDEKSNLLILREPPQNLELAERLMRVYDQDIPEVMLEVEVLEVQSSRVNSLGIAYPQSITFSPLGDTSNSSGSSTLTLRSLQNINSSTIGVGVGSLAVNLQRTLGDFTVLANPRIRAKNHEKASILVGNKIPIFTSSAAPTAGLVTQNIQYMDVGVKMEFEPSISVSNEVSIKVSLEASTLGNQIQGSGGAVAYEIGTRTASTTLRLKDGEIQMLGGLVNNQTSSSSARIPGLGDIPILGHLFSTDSSDDEKTEVVLAIMPHIVRNLRTPDANNGSFYSGTEAVLRAEPIQTGNQENKPRGPIAGPSTPAGMPANTGTPFGTVNAAPPSVGTSTAPLPSGGLPPGSPLSANGGMPGTMPSPANSVRPADSALPAGSAGPVSEVLPVNGGAPASGPITLLWGKPTDAKLGSTVDLPIQIQAGSDIRGLPMQIHYDPKKLQLTEVQEGSFMKGNDQLSNLSQSNDAGSGFIALGIVRSAPSGVHGEGTLVTLRFKALEAGKTSVTINSASVISSAVGDAGVSLPPALDLTVH